MFLKLQNHILFTVSLQCVSFAKIIFCKYFVQFEEKKKSFSTLSRVANIKGRDLR